jgi:hypothetical protein
VVAGPETHEFLSDGWLDAARKIRAHDGATAQSVAVTMNLTVTDMPFSQQPVVVNLDTARGVLALEPGAVAQPDVTVTVDWLTAKSLLLGGDTSAVMSAFMAGTLTLEGDMAKVVALQTATADASSKRVLEHLRAITA